MARVLIYYWGRRGGGAKYTLEMARALAAESDLSLHLSLSRQNELYRDFAGLGLPRCDVDTLSVPLGSISALLRTPLAQRRLSRYLREQEIDLVYATMSTIWGALALSAVTSSGARYLHTVHDAAPHPGENLPIPQRLLAREIAASDGLVALSEHVKQQLVASFAYPAERIWTIPVGLFAYGELPRQARRLPQDRPLRLMFFGRILPYKGLDLLLEAFGALRQRHEVELSIVGGGDLGSYREALARLPGLEVDNRWIPEDEIGAAIVRADIMVLPYRESSQSGVAPLAYAAAIPVVATPVGGLREQVRDGDTGLLAGEISASALAASVARLLDDPALYRRCSEGALAIVQGELSWPVLARQVAAAMETILR